MRPIMSRLVPLFLAFVLVFTSVGVSAQDESAGFDVGFEPVAEG